MNKYCSIQLSYFLISEYDHVFQGFFPPISEFLPYVPYWLLVQSSCHYLPQNQQDTISIHWQMGTTWRYAWVLNNISLKVYTPSQGASSMFRVVLLSRKYSTACLSQKHHPSPTSHWRIPLKGSNFVLIFMKMPLKSSSERHLRCFLLFIFEECFFHLTLTKLV